MKKAIEIVEYLAGVHTQNLLALPGYTCTTDEGRAFLDLWAEHLNKEVVLLADLRAQIFRKQSLTTAAGCLSGKAIEWDHDEHFNEWTESKYGFHISLDSNEPVETQYAAAWGEGDCEHFATLAEAQAWCQDQIDEWIRSCAVIDQSHVSTHHSATAVRPEMGKPELFAHCIDSEGKERLHPESQCRVCQWMGGGKGPDYYVPLSDYMALRQLPAVDDGLNDNLAPRAP